MVFFFYQWSICGLELRFIRVNEVDVKNLLWARVPK
jgi:hypothetical protein